MCIIVNYEYEVCFKYNMECLQGSNANAYLWQIPSVCWYWQYIWYKFIHILTVSLFILNSQHCSPSWLLNWPTHTQHSNTHLAFIIILNDIIGKKLTAECRPYIWGAFHKTSHQWQITVVVISYWNPGFWLVVSKVVIDFCHLSLEKGFVKRSPDLQLYSSRTK